VTQREWDAARYDRLAEPQTRWGAAVLERLHLNGDEAVLDAGCGTGRVTEQLLDRLPHGRVIALDASARMLDEARCRLAGHDHRVSFVRADLLELTAQDLGGPVDAVLSTATFHWITDHDRLFANLAAVLRPGGQLAAQFGGKGNITRVTETVRSLGVDRAGSWLYPSPEQTAERLTRAGFTDVRAWKHPEPTPFPPGAPLADFLETVCLREHLATLPVAERRRFAERVAAAMPEPVIDYVRLNVTARRGPTPAAAR
jgi:trans-aconitate 2-methyltransferase